VRILLDECVNPRVRQAFPHHKVVTVAEVEWRALPDAELIAQAQSECDVLVTIDKGFEHEHNLKKLAFGIVIVHVPKNRIEYYRPLFQVLVGAVERVRPGEVIHVTAPPI
jgi:predicted nuclease of predicted toxin-antitoxin system